MTRKSCLVPGRDINRLILFRPGVRQGTPIHREEDSVPRIVNVLDHPGGLEPAVAYIHRQWGNEGNHAFYFDCARHSSRGPSGLPRFYVLMEGQAIIGCCALLVNDLISRQDLWPWLGCLYVDPEWRGRRLSEALMDHARAEAHRAGFCELFLSTTHEGLYEKFGWTRLADGYNSSGERFGIYRIATT